MERLELKSGLAFANCKEVAALKPVQLSFPLLGQARTSGCHRSPALSKSRSGRGSLVSGTLGSNGKAYAGQRRQSERAQSSPSREAAIDPMIPSKKESEGERQRNRA